MATMNLRSAEANRAINELGAEYHKQFRLDVIEKLSNKLQSDWTRKDKEEARLLYPEDMDIILEAQFELYDCMNYEQRKVQAVNHFNRKRELADAIYKDTLAKLETVDSNKKLRMEIKARYLKGSRIYRLATISREDWSDRQEDYFYTLELETMAWINLKQDQMDLEELDRLDL